MIRYEVKVTDEILFILEAFPLTHEGVGLTTRDTLVCEEDGTWYIRGMFVFFSPKLGDANYLDDKFTEWLKKHCPEALI